MKPSTLQKEVRQLIGVVKYYNNIWARYSHKLAPLTNNESNNVKFKRTKIEQDKFDEIKRIVARGLFLAYPDFNEAFKNDTNASKLKL